MTGNAFRPHPDDQQLLDSLVDALAAYRVAAGVSQRGLARAALVTRGTVAALETRRPANPLAATLQRYGGLLGLTLRLDVEGLGAVPPPPQAGALRAGGYPGAAVLAHLRAVRQGLGLRLTDITAATGWSWSALGTFETSDREPLVSMLQRYARALGGRTVPSWEESC